MKRRQIWALLLAVGLIVGCRWGLDEVMPTRQPIAPEGDRVTISFACSDQELDVYDTLAAQFEAIQPRIDVRILSIDQILEPHREGNRWPENAGLRVLSAADTARWYPSPQETQQGIIHDLTPFVEADPSFQVDDFYPGMLEAAQWDGGTWILPTGADLTLFFFDKGAFAVQGQPYPEPGWSWQDLERRATAMMERQGDEATRFGYVAPWGHNLLTAYLADHNVPWEDRSTAPPMPLLDSPAVAQGVQWYVRFLENVAPYFPPEERSFQAMSLIEEGRAAMWTEFAGNYEVRTQNMAVGVAPFPSDGGGTTPLMASGHVMSAGTAHPDEAWRWLDFLSRQEPVGWSPGAIPARRSVAEASGFWEELDEELAEATRYALDHSLVGMPLAFDSTGQALEQAVEVVLAGQKELTQALAEAQQEALAARPAVLSTVEIHVAEVAAPASDAITGEEATITFIGGFGDLSAYRELAEAFRESHPGITVKVRSEPDYTIMLDLAQVAAAGDCFRWGAGVGAGDTGYILDLGPFLDADPNFPRNDFYPVFWEMCEQQGAIWCLPFDGDANVIRYNPILFDAASLAYPQTGWTLDDFLAKAVALTRGEGVGKQYGFSSYGLEGVAFHVFVRIRGGSLWNLDLSPPRPRFDEPAVVEAVQMYADLARVHGVKPAVHFGLSAEEWQAEIEPTMHLVQTGKAAMWVGFASASPYQPAGIPSAGIVPLPQQDGRGVSSVWGYGHYISAQTQHRQACWTWIRFLVDRLKPVTGIPARCSLAESVALRQKAGDDVAAVYLHVMEQADDPASQMTAQPPWMWRANHWVYEAYDAVLDGADAAQALGQAQVRAEQYILCLETRQGYDDGNLTLACAREVDPDYPLTPGPE